MKKQQVRNMKRTRRKFKTLVIFNPIHIIVGLVLIGVGSDLLFHDHYFMWPPGADAYINSDFVGAWGIFAGAGLIYVALQKNFPIKANFVWITLSSAFWGFEVFMEFMHSLIFYDPGRMLALFFEGGGYLLFTFLMICNSPTRKDMDRRG